MLVFIIRFVLGFAFLAYPTSPTAGAEEGSPKIDTQVSAEVVLHRKNTMGGWEIFAALRRQEDEFWISLRVNDLGNFKTKILKVEKIHFKVDGHPFDVACEHGVSVNRRLRGIGILGDDTSHHLCSIAEDQVKRFGEASEIHSQVTVAGKTTKVRKWKDKGRARWASFLLMD